MGIGPTPPRRRRFGTIEFVTGGTAIALVYTAAWITSPAAASGTTTVNPALLALATTVPFVGATSVAARIARRAAFRIITTLVVALGVIWYLIVALTMGFLPLHDLFYCGGVDHDPCATTWITRATVAAAIAATWTAAAIAFASLSTLRGTSTGAEESGPPRGASQ